MSGRWAYGGRGGAAGSGGGGSASLNLFQKIKLHAVTGAAEQGASPGLKNGDWGNSPFERYSTVATITDNSGGVNIGRAAHYQTNTSVRAGIGYATAGWGNAGCYGCTFLFHQQDKTEDYRLVAGFMVDATNSELHATSDAPNNRANAYLRVSKAAGDVNFMICSNVAPGGTTTAEDTGVPYDATKAYEVAVAVDDQDKVYWAIQEQGSDEIHTGEKTTDVPDSTGSNTNYHAIPALMVTPLAAGTYGIAIASVYVGVGPKGLWE